MKDFLKKHSLFRAGEFLVLASLLGAVKQILISQLPIHAAATGMMDDALMVRGAQSMLRGQWLGDYDQFTLVKGFFFPAFLAVSKQVGISYVAAATLLYTLACVVFILGVRPLFKSKYPLYVSYAVLLFNPVTFSFHVLQRVYRNSLSQAQVLMILGCFFALYLRRKEKAVKLLPWALGAGFFWVSLEHSREDAVWILPVLLVIMVITAGVLIREMGRKAIGRICLVILPFISLMASHPAVAAVNRAYYGLHSYNELNDSHFADAMKSLYSVKMEGEDIPYVSVSREKLRLLYDISPALADIEPSLERLCDSWDSTDRTPGDKEVEDGWFFWVIREAAAERGYFENAVKADAYFEQLSTEIEAALDEGRLERQPVMPSALMPPWRSGRLTAVLEAYGQVIPYVMSYSEVRVDAVASEPTYTDGIDLFEAVTNNRAIYPEEERFSQETSQAHYIAMVLPYLHRLNRLTALYQKTGIPAAVLGILSYLVLSAMAVFEIKRKRTFEYASIWLVLTGLLGGLLILFGGIAYNHAASCYSITYLYLCAAYPMLIGFWTLGAGYLAEHLVWKITGREHVCAEHN